MKLFTLSLFVIASVFTLGCSSENPMLPTAADVVNAAGCVTDIEKNEDGQYIVRADAECIDSLLDKQTQAPLPPGVKSVELTTIVDDVAIGSTDFLHNWVYIEASVTSDLTDNGRRLLLETNNDNVKFSISSFVKKSQLSRWTKGNSYGFILFIDAIQTNSETGVITIFSRVDDPDNIAKGRSVLTPTSLGVLATSIDVIIESFRNGESYFIGKRVGFIGTVQEREDNKTVEGRVTTFDSLVVYAEKRNIFTVSRDTFVIYPTMKLFEGNIDPKYSKGSLHYFQVTIHYLSGEDFFDPNKVSITGYLEDKTFVPNP